MTENRYSQLLTKGALGHMLSGTKIEDAVVQLLACYRDSNSMDSGRSCGVILSDGLYYSYRCCIIICPFAIEFQENVFDRYCLLKIPKYLLNEVQDRPVIVLHDLKLLVRGSEVGDRLGAPVEFGSLGAPPLSNFERNYQWNYQPQLVDIEMEFENLAIDNLPQTMCLAEKMSTGSFRTNWRNLRDLSNLKNDVNALKTFELGDLQTFQTKAVIVQTENAFFYRGCKVCNEELTDLRMIIDDGLTTKRLENGIYYCEKCHQNTFEFNCRLVLSLCLGDHTGQTWVQAFHDDSLKLLGEETNLEELYGLYTNSLSEFENRIRSCNFSAFIFKLKSELRFDTYNVSDVDYPFCVTEVCLHRVNYVEYANELLRKIRED